MEWRRSYIEWISELGTKNNCLVWWSSRIAERNTFLNSLYHKICYAGIGRILLEKELGPLLIVAESPAVLQTIASFPKRQRQVQWVRPEGILKTRVKWFCCLIYRLARYLAAAIVEMWDARRTRQGRPILPPQTEKPRVLLHTWVDESYFGSDGCAKDRYYTVLPEELRRRGYDVVSVPFLYNLQRSRREAFEWFRLHPERYLIPEDFYSLADYLWASWIIVRQTRLLPGSHRLADMEITALVREACLDVNLDLARVIRYYRLVKRWSQLGLKINVFIDTFENHAVEKPQVMALHRYFPLVMTVGFEHYTAPYPLWLCAFTTPKESATAPHPEVIVCSSPWTARLFAKEGFAPEKLRVGPSLRYLHLANTAMNRETVERMVVVALSIHKDANTELVQKLLDAFPSDEKIRFLVKLHPMTPALEWNAILNGRPLPRHMEVVNGPIESWLPTAAGAIVSASTVALEIALTGVPITLAGRETDFDINQLYWFPELGSPVYSTQQLRARVLSMLTLSSEERERLAQWAERTRQDCFSPVTDETIAAFVQPAPVQTRNSN